MMLHLKIQQNLLGRFMEKIKAEELQKEKNYVMVEDSGRGYRRVVASPKPKKIVVRSRTDKNINR